MFKDLMPRDIESACEGSKPFAMATSRVTLDTLQNESSTVFQLSYISFWKPLFQQQQNVPIFNHNDFSQKLCDFLHYTIPRYGSCCARISCDMSSNNAKTNVPASRNEGKEQWQKHPSNLRRFRKPSWVIVFAKLNTSVALVPRDLVESRHISPFVSYHSSPQSRPTKCFGPAWLGQGTLESAKE